jgi:hypothetical protein
MFAGRVFETAALVPPQGTLVCRGTPIGLGITGLLPDITRDKKNNHESETMHMLGFYKIYDVQNIFVFFTRKKN